jgi:hypothetical protein
MRTSTGTRLLQSLPTLRSDPTRSEYHTRPMLRKQVTSYRFRTCGRGAGYGQLFGFVAVPEEVVIAFPHPFA